VQDLCFEFDLESRNSVFRSLSLCVFRSLARSFADAVFVSIVLFFAVFFFSGGSRRNARRPLLLQTTNQRQKAVFRNVSEHHLVDGRSLSPFLPPSLSPCLPLCLLRSPPATLRPHHQCFFFFFFFLGVEFFVVGGGWGSVTLGFCQIWLQVTQEI
jgi:hypothetical protein